MYASVGASGLSQIRIPTLAAQRHVFSIRFCIPTCTYIHTWICICVVTLAGGLHVAIYALGSQPLLRPPPPSSDRNSMSSFRGPVSRSRRESRRHEHRCRYPEAQTRRLLVLQLHPAQPTASSPWLPAVSHILSSCPRKNSTPAENERGHGRGQDGTSAPASVGLGICPHRWRLAVARAISSSTCEASQLPVWD